MHRLIKVLLMGVILLGLDCIYNATFLPTTQLEPQFHLSPRHNQPKNKKQTTKTKPQWTPKKCSILSINHLLVCFVIVLLQSMKFAILTNYNIGVMPT